MPKRLSKPTRERQRDFLSGYSTGVTAVIFAVQLRNLRLNKGVTQEEVATATELSVKTVKGLEEAEVNAFLNTELDSLTALANYFDVSLDVIFTTSIKPPDTAHVPTFEED